MISVTDKRPPGFKAAKISLSPASRSGRGTEGDLRCLEARRPLVRDRNHIRSAFSVSPDRRATGWCRRVPREGFSWQSHRVYIEFGEAPRPDEAIDVKRRRGRKPRS